MTPLAEKDSSLLYVECTEQKRLNETRERGVSWEKWRPYLSERQWGTVREDYSQDGNAWNYFSHDQFDMFARMDSARMLQTSKQALVGEMTHEQVAG